MDKVGIVFYTWNEILLTLGARKLHVHFNGAEVSRLIVIEPAVRQLLPQIMLQQKRRRMAWTDLRSLLEACGLDLHALPLSDPPRRPEQPTG